MLSLQTATDKSSYSFCLQARRHRKQEEDQDTPSLPGDGVETSSENGCSYVTSRSGHTGYSGPIVCSDVVDLNRVEVRNTIKASNYIDVVVE